MSETISVPMKAQRDIRTVTTEIRTLHRQAQGVILSYAIEIGRRLKEAKSLLGHGEWGEWLESEVDFSRSTANNFMKIFEEYGASQVSLFGDANSQTLGNLPYTHALKLLAVPAEEREEFAEAHHVEELTSRELEKLIRERDEARRALKRAEEDRDRAKRQAAEAEQHQQAALRAQEEAQQAQAEAMRAKEAACAMEQKLEALKRQQEAAPVEDTALEQAREQARQEERSRAEEQVQAAREEAKKAREEAEAAVQKAEKARQEAEEQARAAQERAAKEQLLADGDMAVFKELFRRVQEDFGQMEETIRRIGAKNAESAEKLRGAVQALVRQWTA